MNPKTLLAINSVNFGSTGNIMLQVAEKARKKGFTVYTSCANSRSNRKKIVDNQFFLGTRLGRNVHIQLAKITGLNGCFSIIDTWLFLCKIKRLKIDVIHLHNLHNCYINLPMLFRFIKKHSIRVIWTLHDCWAFTGQCPYFDMVQCEKWKSECYSCPQYRLYPKSCVDQTRLMHKMKKRWFGGIEDILIVTPSRWLSDRVSESFLKDYPIQVVPNGIDLDIFQKYKGSLRDQYGLVGKFVLLGVAFDWGKRKGLDVFIQLASQLRENYQIVLVGTDKEVEDNLPPNIITIRRTSSQKELAEIYSCADVFVNPTREEVFGLVNIEALACGTPVVTFDSGGSPECIDENCGVVVPRNNVSELVSSIIKVCEHNGFSETSCRSRAASFSLDLMCKHYVSLYDMFLNNNY